MLGAAFFINHALLNNGHKKFVSKLVHITFASVEPIAATCGADAAVQSS